MFFFSNIRAENSQLHQQRERLIHDHELVCHENERLLKKLTAPGQNCDNNNKRSSIDHQTNVNGLSVDQNGKKQKDKENLKHPNVNEKQSKQIQFKQNDAIGIIKDNFVFFASLVCSNRSQSQF